MIAYQDVQLALADMLLDQPRGTAAAWDDMERSAALETTNIVACAYLTALARVVPHEAAESTEMLPSPPQFSQEYAESLIEFALMGQAMATDHVLLAKTRFEVDGEPVNWTLLCVPDADSMARLRTLFDQGAGH